MKKTLVWVGIVLVVFAIGWVVASKTYHPPDPVMEQSSTSPTIAPTQTTTPVTFPAASG